MSQVILQSIRRTSTLFASSRLAVLGRPESLFLFLAIPFGIIFIFLSAPFQAPDEYNHFYRAYAISTGHFTGLQVTLPKSVLDFSTIVSKDLPGNDQNRQSKKALVQEFFRPFEEQPQDSVAIVNSAIVSPIPYLPQAFGILMGRLAHLHPIFIFYLGRITNFLTWLGLTFLAIRTTPIHRRLFAALALMPMTIHQAASNSPDAATIAIGFLFIAFALRILMDQNLKIQWSDWAWIGLLGIALALCKSIYVLAAGLLIAVPVRRFRQQPVTIPLTLAVIGLGIASGLIWLQSSSRIVSVEMMNTFRTPTLGSIGYILQHPVLVAPVFWRSAIVYTPGVVRMFVGVLGWMDTVLPGWVYPLYYALLLFAVIFEPHSQSFFFIRERILMALMAILSCFLIMAIFFYPGVSVGNGIVDIIQGRYFIPLGPFFFLPFSQRKWAISQDSPAWVAVGLLHGLVLMAAIRAMLWRYYSI